MTHSAPKLSASEKRALEKIAERAKRMGVPWPVGTELLMVHARIMPLDLAALADAAFHDFVHDILGIHRHLDRQNGTLTGFFVPRFALPDNPVQEAAS